MHLTMAIKRIADSWEGALILENRFQRALSGAKLEDVVLKGLIGLLETDLVAGTHVVFDVKTESPDEVARATALQDAAAAEREAHEELAKIEAARGAREKIRLAKEALRKETQS